MTAIQQPLLGVDQGAELIERAGEILDDPAMDPWLSDERGATYLNITRPEMMTVIAADARRRVNDPDDINLGYDEMRGNESARVERKMGQLRDTTKRAKAHIIDSVSASRLTPIDQVAERVVGLQRSRFPTVHGAFSRLESGLVVADADQPEGSMVAAMFEAARSDSQHARKLGLIVVENERRIHFYAKRAFTYAYHLARKNYRAK